MADKITGETVDTAINPAINTDMAKLTCPYCNVSVHSFVGHNCKEGKLSQAKEPETNTGQAKGNPVQGSSRLVAGRTATATSEFMDATAGETAPNSRRGRPRKGEPKPPKYEPWVALDISERTWYRRQKEKSGD